MLNTTIWQCQTPLLLLDTGFHLLQAKSGPLLQYVVRLGCNPGHQTWKFWLDVRKQNPGVRIEVSTSIVVISPTLQLFVDALPSWSAGMPATTYQSSWDF